jgi:hypothetical protein
MSNVQSYNALIDRFKAFASGHFILKTFSHGQIDTADLEKFTEYPFMHVVPSNVTYAKGTKTFSFQIVLADLPRDKTDKVEFQREVLSDLQRIAEDLVAEITNHRVLFGDLITVQNVTLEPFLEEFHNTLTGWTVSLELLVPYYWDACSIPAEWNDMWESSTGGTGSILTFIDSITRDNNGNVSLVNDEATPAPNYYYGTNDEGVRGWYLTTDNIGLTCETIGDCQTIIDIEAAIDALEEEILLKADITSISAVGFSNDYNDLSNLPTIPTATSDLTNDSGFITIGDVPAQVNADWNSTTGVSEILNKPTIPAGGLPAGGTAGQILTKVDATDYNATWQENFADWTSVVKHIVKNNGLSGTITKGTAVYVTGSNGTNMLVGRASNTSEATSSKTMGLMQSDITTTGGNQTGFVITEGLLEGLNTAGQTAGDPVWLGVNGALIYGLANKPYAPAHLVFIGIVTKVSAGNGEIFVKVQNGFELKEIHDVDLITTTPINGHVLGFDGTLWVNKTVAGWLGFTPVTNARTITINGTTQDLSADRTFTIATNAGTVTSVSALTLGTTGTDLSSTVATGTTTPVITLNVPTASATNRGALSSTDWSTFNSKISGLTIGTTAIASGAVNRILFQGTGNVLQESLKFTFDEVTNSNTRLLMKHGTAQASIIDFTATTGDYSGGFLSTGPTFSYGTYATNSANLTGGTGGVAIRVTSSSNFAIHGVNASVDNATKQFQLFGATGNVLIQNGGTYTDAGYKLDVNGTARVNGLLTAGSNVNLAGSILYLNQGGASTSYVRNNASITILNGPQISLSGGTVSITATTNGANSDASAILDVQSTAKGVLFPRMTTTQKNAIASPASGLVVYDTTLGKLCVRGAAAWETITSI